MASSKLAPWCSRFSKGTAIPREKTRLSLFEPAFLRPTRLLTADQLLNRRVASNVNASTTDADLLAQDTLELDNMITRSEESMVANCLFSGKFTCRDGDTGEIVAELNYGPISETVVSPPWSDTTNGDPLKDLKTAMRLVSFAGGFSADTVVMGTDAFEAHPKVLNAFDKKFVEPGVNSPKLLQWGVTVLGQWRGIPLYADEQTYEDCAGTEVPFCDPKSVLIAASGSQNTMAYAGVPQAEDDHMEVYEGRRIPLVFFDKGEDYRKLRLSSRPVPIPSNTASWTVLQVLA